MTDELIGDLEAPQPTSEEAALVRGGNIGGAMAAKLIPSVVVPTIPTTTTQGGNGGGQQDPLAQTFQQILNQIMG